MTAPQVAEARRRAGRMGGQVKAMRYAGCQHEGTASARAAYRRAFADGTHYCRLCRDRAQFDASDLLPEQRNAAAEHALRFHMEQMRLVREQHVRRRKEARRDR